MTDIAVAWVRVGGGRTWQWKGESNDKGEDDDDKRLCFSRSNVSFEEYKLYPSAITQLTA